MTETTTPAFVERRASDYPAEARFKTADGVFVTPDPDGCWVREDGFHKGQVLSLTEAEPAPTEPQVSPEVADLTEQVRLLRSRIDTLSEALRDSEAHHANVRQAIIDEAKERQWCEEVNTFLENVGYDRWETEYEVTLTYTINVTQAGCIDREDAIDRALDDLFEDRYAFTPDTDVTEV